MAVINDGFGRHIAWEMFDEETVDISSSDFDPDTTGGSTKTKWLKSGFFVKVIDGSTFNAILWIDYKNNGYSLTGLTAQTITPPENDWYMERMALVETGSAAQSIVVGINN